MAEQIISPGVFTRENDLSFLPQGVGAIGAAIVGPTVKGPAFVPTVVRSFAEYERRFGGLSKDTFVPQTVREYLRNAGSVTVCRVLAGGGFTFIDGINEPIAVVASKGTTKAGKVPSSSIVFNVAPNNTAAGVDTNPDRVIFGEGDSAITFIFVEDTAAYTDSATQIFVDAGTEADKETACVSLAAKFNANASVINGGPLQFTATSSAALGSVLLDINGIRQTAADNIVITTGSITGTANALTILPFADLGNLGGTDAVTADNANVLLGVIYPSKATSTPSLSTSEITTSTPNMSGSFTLELKGSGVTTTAFKTSTNPSNDNYLFKYLGNTPDNSKESVKLYNGTPGYSYLNFKNLQTNLHATESLSGYSGFGSGSEVKLVTIKENITFNGNKGQSEGYSWASTPFITSQLALGEKQLFQFHSLGHGTKCNTDYKVSITNLREPGDIDGEEQYSTFTITLRKYSDIDKSPNILEQYNNVNLNPDSPKYIARVIGDRYPLYNENLSKVELKGNFSNVSQLCRVEVSDAVASKATSPKLSPKGFIVISNPIASSSFNTNLNFGIPSASYEGEQAIGGNYNNRGYLGWKFDEKDLDNKNFLKPVDTTGEANVVGNFSVENYNGHASSSLWTESLSASIDTTGATGPTSDQLKFSIPFQGGFDGLAPYKVKFIGNESSLDSTYEDGTNLYGFDMTNGTSGSKGYKKAIDILSNQDEYDINMLALPGVLKSLHSNVTNAAIDMCEERGDTFYVMDLTQYNSSINTAINDARGLDTNYAATYYPWVKVLDTAQNKPVLVPPSVIVPGAIAASDRIAAEWFAPAGLNRGVLGNVIEAKMRLNQAERDRLYNDKINPIATFPQTGVCIWGQKTLQERSSALDRINVRRLLIALKKFIASSSRYLVFEQNTNATRNRFLNIVNPYLESVQQRQGLYSFRVQMDEANNTADVIDRNQLVGAIYLQPTKTAEFIVLDFNVLPTGATFE